MVSIVSPEAQSAGDPIPPNCELIEIHLAELKQLFNSMDPSPFAERDLDPNAEEFIVGWAQEAPPDAPIGLLIHLDRSPGLAEEPVLLRDAIRRFFAGRADRSRRQLRMLFRRGRISLFIGLIFLATCIAAGDLIASVMSGRRVGEILRESLLIGGWVAMWRPLEIFLYDWWPIRAERRLYQRLSIVSVRITYSDHAIHDAWRQDWPAENPAQELRLSRT